MFQPVPNPVDYLPASAVLRDGAAVPDADHQAPTSCTPRWRRPPRCRIAKGPQAGPRAGFTCDQLRREDQLHRRAGLQAVRPEVQVLRAQADLQQPPARSAAVLATSSGQRPARRRSRSTWAKPTTTRPSWRNGTPRASATTSTPARPSSRSRTRRWSPPCSSTSTSSRPCGGKVDQLGEQAASAFLLWATAAKSCGSTLTRQCMLNYLAKVHNWTGGGLQRLADPGANMPAECGMLAEADGHHAGRSSIRRPRASSTATRATSSISPAPRRARR